MAAEAGVPHALVISSIGADAGGRAPGWLHPLAYFRTMGEKEEATLQASALLRVSIFRPGKLTRTPTGGDRVLRALGLGLPVDVLAAAMVHDAEAAADSDRRSVVRHAGSSAIRRLAAQLVEA